jgi:fibronectin type 3 domain-containing protein
MKVAKLKDPLRITGIKLTVLKTKSILTWDKNEKAESYNIYKKKDDGTLEFIQNVKDSYFEVAITGDKVTYDYFAIK